MRLIGLSRTPGKRVRSAVKSVRLARGSDSLTGVRERPIGLTDRIPTASHLGLPRPPTSDSVTDQTDQTDHTDQIQVLDFLLEKEDLFFFFQFLVPCSLVSRSTAIYAPPHLPHLVYVLNLMGSYLGDFARVLYGSMFED